MTDIPITKAKLAKELGITRQSINTWIKRGDLVFDESGKMSVDEFNKQLGSKLHPVSKIRDEKYYPIFNTTDTSAEDVELDFHAARTIREIAEAKTAEFKLNIMRGNYVEKSEVDKFVFERGRQFRDGLMSLSRKLAPEIAGNPSISEVESIMNAEFRFILEGFANLPAPE